MGQKPSYLTSIFIQSLDTSQAVGIDGIGPRVLKIVQHRCVAFFVIYSVLSLTTGFLLQKWKTYIIILIHMSNYRSLINHYRPISLLSNSSKVLERLVYNHIIKQVLCTISLI